SLVTVLAHIVKYGRNIPLAEDWTMVPAMTGHEHHFWSWLWAQNNEHRLPLPKLAYLGALKLTGDFRSGMVLSTLVVAAASAALILLMRRLRGRTSIADAFFPLVLMHLGHWENLLWSWQIQFVMSVGLVIGVLVVVAGASGPLSPRRALAGATCLVL